MWKKSVLIVTCALFAFSLLWPLAQGEQPLTLGLDLSGGAMVTYRPDFDDIPEHHADLPRAELLALAKETLAGRLMQRFDTLPDVVVRSDDRIVVSLPGEHDQRRILETIGETYRLTFRRALAVYDAPPEQALGLLRHHEGRWLDLGEELLEGGMLDPRSIRVETAAPSLESLGQGVSISFEFRPPYDQRFAEITRDSVGETLAILLDDEVEWAGLVQQEIRGTGQLSGGYTLEEATEVAALLRSGDLPLSLEVESISGVGPTLGQELLDRGQLALGWSAALLALLVLVAYGHRPALLATGWTSLACLFFFTLGFITTFDLTVDLAAIAGLVLSIGMGMDAFILVFEALEGGGSQSSAARSPLGRLRQIYSFSGEGRTLLHANATTLLVVLLLFLPDRLRSFALFLVVGLAASLLTLLVTRSLLAFFARRGWLEATDRPSFLTLVRRSQPGLFRLRHLYFAVLAIFLVGSALWLQQNRPGDWLELGADFQPGMQLAVTLPPEHDIESLIGELRAEYPDFEARHQSWNGDGAAANDYLITLEGRPRQDGVGTQNGDGPDPQILAADLGRWLENRQVELQQIHSIDARLSSSRMLSSLSVLAGSFLLLALYLGVAQRRIDGWLAPAVRWRSDSGNRIIFGTVLAVVLDVAVMLAALALLGIPLGMPVIAALLTIVGYSVNDSMVLWSHLTRPDGDRRDGRSPDERIRDGVDEMMSRTLLTSLSTMVPALVILAVGLEPLRGFAWAVLIGTVAGTLSSIFIVASCVREGLQPLSGRVSRWRVNADSSFGKLRSERRG